MLIALLTCVRAVVIIFATTCVVITVIYRISGIVKLKPFHFSMVEYDAANFGGPAGCA